MARDISEQDLQQHIDSMPLEMTPKRELWTGIEKAIASTPQSSINNANTATLVATKKPYMPVAWAASITVAIFATWLTLSPTTQQSTMPVDLAKVMESEFNQQKQLMLTSFGQPKIKELPAEMQTQLTELTKAQQAISKALVNDPNNAELLNLLRWTQKQELDLLKQLFSPQWQTI